MDNEDRVTDIVPYVYANSLATSTPMKKIFLMIISIFIHRAVFTITKQPGTTR